MEQTEKLYRSHKEATNYIEKIGKPQLHFRDGSVGRINKLQVETQICHQENTGDSNYHDNADFDCALAEVVKLNFHALAVEALALMRSKADASLVAEKSALLSRLGAIEALEAKEVI